MSFTNGEIGVVDSYHTYINTDPVTTNPSCLDDECEYLNDVPLNLCNGPEADISVTFTAKNELGESTPSKFLDFGRECVVLVLLVCFMAL